MADYVLPQVLIFQEFAIAPTALTAPLRACPVGEHFALNRYSDADEKSGIRVTSSYDPNADESFLWPNRPAGAVVDQTYTKVYIDDALLQYYNDPSGDASEVKVVSGERDQIRFDALVLATANGFSRSSSFGDRDVKVGDVLDIVASACGEAFSLRTSILQLIADTIPAVIGSAEAADDNQSTVTETTSDTQTAGADNQVIVESVDASSYDGREAGAIQETYRVEVIGGGVGGDATSALLQVTRLSDGQISQITPSAFGSPTQLDSRGATVTWNNTGSSSSGASVDQDDFVVGQKWTITVRQAFTAVATESGGTYSGASDTTYIVEVVKGGDFGTAQIRVRTNTGVDSSPATVVSSLGTAVPIGTQGITIKFTTAPDGLVTGDIFTITATAADDGAIKTVQLATPLPPELRGICEVDVGSSSSSSSSGPAPDLGVTFYIKTDIEVPEGRVNQAPLVNWEQSETEITLKAGITAFDASWTVNGVLQALPVKDGIVYVEHRDRLNTWCGTVGSIDDIDDISTVFSDGPVIDPDNPLVFGVYKALQNANGTAVKFTAVCSSSPVTLNDWLDALNALQSRDDVYSLVPLTFDKQVQDAFVAHVEAQSASDVGRWRIAWLCRQAQESKGVYTTSQAVGAESDDPVLATITDDPNTSGTQYTLVSAEGEQFITDPDSDVKAGDIVRANYVDDGFGNITYDEYVIDAVLNDEELRLTSGPSSAVSVASKIEIWRNLSKTQLAQELATYPGEAGGTRRAYLVWPDEIGNAGQTFAGYFLCASLAGLRSASYPHRPLTNVEIVGYDDVSRTTEFFNESQLNTMAAAGYWIVTQDPNDGDVFTRHQLSTNNEDLLRVEQSITTNVDSISYTFLRRLAPYIGRANVTPTMINIIEGEVEAVLNFFQNFSPNDELGPQLLGATIDTLQQHPVLSDRIQVLLDITVPAPLNNIELRLRVSV